MPVWETEADDEVQGAHARSPRTLRGSPARPSSSHAIPPATQGNARQRDRRRAVRRRGEGSNADALHQLKHGFGVTPQYYAAGDTPELPASLAETGLEAQLPESFAQAVSRPGAVLDFSSAFSAT